MNGAQSTGDPLRDWVIAESHVDATGHWRLLRHGGRRCDHWRDLKCPDAPTTRSRPASSTTPSVAACARVD